MSTHTPGPWWHDTGGKSDWGGMVRGADHKPVATTAMAARFDVGKHEPPPEIAANARLIAAAPDLLDALKWAERQLFALVTDDDGSGAIIRGTSTELAGFGAGVGKMRAAIAKAEGRS